MATYEDALKRLMARARGNGVKHKQTRAYEKARRAKKRAAKAHHKLENLQRVVKAARSVIERYGKDDFLVKMQELARELEMAGCFEDGPGKVPYVPSTKYKKAEGKREGGFKKAYANEKRRLLEKYQTILPPDDGSPWELL